MKTDTKQELKEALKSLLRFVSTTLLVIFAFGSSFIGFAEFCDYIKTPDWLRWILALPALGVSVFIAKSSANEFSKEWDKRK